MAARLLEKYRNEVSPALAKQFGCRNPMAVPRLAKIVVSMGIGDAHAEQGKLEAAAKQLAQVTGQQPVVTTARKSISNFKLLSSNLPPPMQSVERIRIRPSGLNSSSKSESDCLVLRRRLAQQGKPLHRQT